MFGEGRKVHAGDSKASFGSGSGHVFEPIRWRAFEGMKSGFGERVARIQRSGRL